MSATSESAPSRPVASAAPAASGRGASGSSGAGSQTLSRGIRVMEVLAEAPGPMSIAELGEALGLHRSIVYRLLRTLEEHGLVVRDAAGAVHLGPGLAALARSVSRDLQSAALPELTTLANELGMTAFLTVLDDADVTTLVSVEPRHAGAAVAQRPGSRHALDVGAPGAAIRWLLGADELGRRGLPRPALEGSAAAPYATSRDQVIPGLSSVAVPLYLPGHAPAALAVVHVSPQADPGGIAAALHRAAAAVQADLA
ncbi:MAG: helix-turn-helix domain-containing protein [Arthrobacter sp.]|nr:helix-turn-helix domain-containing protein [Arthrobacter sp.]